MFRKLVLGLALVCLPVTAIASEKVVQPIQVGSETARFSRGVATVTSNQHDGSVQIRVAPMDHGSVAFDVAVFNAGQSPANFDAADVQGQVQGGTLRAYTVKELQKKAKTRAGWRMFAIALAGGLAAAGAASQRDSYSATTTTPHGTYHTYVSGPSAAGQVEAAAIAAGTGYSVVRMQQQLDATLDHLSDQVIQLTTVDPGDSYGGRIVLEKFEAKQLPARIDLVVRWNGEDSKFAFQLAKEGTPAPVFTNPIPVGDTPPPPASPAPTSVPAPAPAQNPSPATV